MRTSSRKAKGRRLQDWTVAQLKSLFDLTDDDVRPAIMGEKGEDVKLSTRARKLIPYTFECKNQEIFKTLYSIYNQAKSNAVKAIEPVVVLKMNRKRPMVLLDAQHFLELICRTNKNKNK